MRKRIQYFEESVHPCTCFEQPAEVVQNLQLTFNVGRLSLVFTLGVNKARENCKYKFNDDLFQEIYMFLWPWAVRALLFRSMMMSFLHRKESTFHFAENTNFKLSYIVKCVETECC